LVCGARGGAQLTVFALEMAGMKRLLVLVLAFLTCASPARAQETLVISIWGGSWRDLVAETAAKKFTAETGAKVEFITGGTIDRLNKAKLAKDNPENDINFTTSHVGWLYANDGLYETLDLSKVPNAANLVPQARISPYHIGVWAYVYTIGRLRANWRPRTSTQAI
jgi:putative spermidine/putrescine transport system substrate-binding protein